MCYIIHIPFFYMRPDYSKYVAHFTKNGAICSSIPNPSISNQTAKQRLISILQSKILLASEMPWTNTKGVCFTESPWASLIEHTKQYSPYGIGFKKQFIYNNGGGPVYYIRADIFSSLSKKGDIIPPKIKTFISPFSPTYRNKYQKNFFKPNVDYSFEREWRIPKDLSFEYSDVEFVIIDTFSDLQDINSILHNNIPINKYIVLENYLRVGKIWPIA